MQSSYERIVLNRVNVKTNVKSPKRTNKNESKNDHGMDNPFQGTIICHAWYTENSNGEYVCHDYSIIVFIYDLNSYFTSIGHCVNDQAFERLHLLNFHRGGQFRSNKIQSARTPLS